MEDDKYREGLPFWYTNMTQFLLVIQRVEFGQISSIFNSTVDAVFSTDKIISQDKSSRTFQTLNGEYLPTICLKSNEWTKLRIVHFDPLNPGYFFFDEACDLQLLTRDGVIIHGTNDTSIPRQLSNIVWLTQAGRADIGI